MDGLNWAFCYTNQDFCHIWQGFLLYDNNDNDNDNESNFIAMNYIDHIIGDVQASSWIRN